MPKFNTMRYDCKKDGCFNIKRRPKIEVFSECFPRNISMGDIDAIVELNGALCIVEWKGDGGQLHTAQKIMHTRITQHHGNIVFVVHGNAETMEVESYFIFWRGKQGKPVAGSLFDVKQRMRDWAKWMETDAWK